VAHSPDVLRPIHALLQRPELLGWVIAISVVTFVASVVGVPFFLARIPADYYSRSESKRPAVSRRPTRVLVVLGKNALGAVLVVLGLLMLVLPGQGVLTLIIGLFLLDFPGKYRIERRLIGSPRVLRVVNALRRRWSQPPLEL
jgi:hypothetical protein